MSLSQKIKSVGQIKKAEGEIHKNLKSMSGKAQANIVNRVTKDPELKRTWLYMFEINRLEQQIEQNPMLVSEMFLDRNKLRVHRLFNSKMKMIAGMDADQLNDTPITKENLMNPWSGSE